MDLLMRSPLSTFTCAGLLASTLTITSWGGVFGGGSMVEQPTANKTIIVMSKILFGIVKISCIWFFLVNSDSEQ
jgi:hypothetical protein